MFIGRLIINMLVVLCFFLISLAIITTLKERIDKAESLTFEKKEKLTKILGNLMGLAQFMMIPLGWFAIYISMNENWGWSYLFKGEVWGYIGMGFLLAIPVLIIAVIRIITQK